MAENKYLWLAAGLLIGYILAKQLCKCSKNIADLPGTPITQPDFSNNPHSTE